MDYYYLDYYQILILWDIGRVGQIGIVACVLNPTTSKYTQQGFYSRYQLEPKRKIGSSQRG